MSNACCLQANNVLGNKGFSDFSTAGFSEKRSLLLLPRNIVAICIVADTRLSAQDQQHSNTVTTSGPQRYHCTILPLGSFILNEYLAPGQDQYWGKIAVNDCDANAEQTTQTLSLVTQMNKILRTSSSVKYQNIGTQEEQIRLNKQMTCGADTCPPLSNANKIL
jgi:hypothetical protein